MSDNCVVIEEGFDVLELAILSLIKNQLYQREKKEEEGEKGRNKLKKSPRYY